MAFRIDRLIWPASPGEQIAVNPAAAIFCAKNSRAGCGTRAVPAR
jgi:hypothetical protein